MSRSLDEPQLEVLGFKVPEDPTDLRVAVVVELGDSASKNNLPTWVFAKKNIDAGPVDLKYFSIGQNVQADVTVIQLNSFIGNTAHDIDSLIREITCECFANLWFGLW